MACKKLFLNYLFIYWIYLFIYLFICIYFIYLFIEIFMPEWVLEILLILNKQSNLFIYSEFVLYKFNYVFFILIFLCLCVCVFRWVSLLFVCLCVFLLIFVCMYVLHVASILAAFVLSLFCLCFSKTIRVIHHYYLPKNLCKREENLLCILFLESQTSSSCNQKS